MNVQFSMGSLFTGVGGFDLASERVGFRVAWQVEIDDAACHVLAHHWPDVPRFRDVRECGAHNLAPVDVITFGSPCQDLSVAGRRAGLEGARSGLFFEAVRIIRELRPALALWEQVPGVLSSGGGRDFGRALDALAECGAMDIGWSILDARHFRLAQRRRRVFTVADFRGRRAAEILAFADGLSGHPAPRREAGEGASRPLASGPPGGSGYRLDADTADNLIPMLAGAVSARQGKGPNTTLDDGAVLAFQNTGHGWWNRDDVAAPIRNGEHGGGAMEANIVASAITAHGHSSPRSDGGDNLVVVNGNSTPEVLTDLAFPLRANDGSGNRQAFAVSLRGREGGATAEMGGDVSTALRASQGGGDKPHALMGMVVRRLTPKEAERLQGFPDDFTAGLADSNRYRLLGNAVAVPVVEWLLRRAAVALQGDQPMTTTALTLPLGLLCLTVLSVAGLLLGGGE